jgi:hypothetical protein
MTSPHRENALGGHQYVVWTARFMNEASGPQGSDASNLEKEGQTVKCDICDQEFANSEEVKRHKEEVHPMGEGDGEKPDLMENSTESEMPEPAERSS